MNSQPNILYIHSHDTGRYIQPYGYSIPTPNLQTLADDGVLFRRAYCCNPTCSPSRAALLTGSYPHQNGMFGLSHRGWSMYDYSKHVVNTLNNHGYTTALSGIQHIISESRTNELGYDHMLIPPGVQGSPELSAASWIYQQKTEEQPFFLSVGFGETHRPYPKGDNLTVSPDSIRPPDPLPDTPEVRKDMAGFATWAKRLDRRMGVVFDALKDTGQWENTLVICTTDHGIPFPEMKCTLFEAGIGVMLIMRGPGGFLGGKTMDGLVSHLDIFPTICDVCNIPEPEWLEGKSIQPLVNEEVSQIRDEVFAEVNYHACYQPMRCISTKRYKYIRRFSDRTKPVLPNCDDGYSKTLWLENGYPKPEQEALYDLLYDPTEKNNLVDSPDYAGIRDELCQRLQKWQEQTNDPILQGPIPPSDEAKLNDIDSLSPHGKTEPFSVNPQY